VDLLHPDIERYLAGLSAHDDAVLAEMERLAARRNFPIVGPQVGRLLEVLARSVGARRVLELGSGFGYSACWFLRALGPTGSVILTEGSAERASEAEAFLSRAGFSGRFRIEVGSALDIAGKLEGPFDVVFNDIDKHDYPAAYGVALRLLRPGGLFISDNMLWSGKVASPDAGDAATAGVIALTRRLYGSADFVSTIVPLRDGVAVAVRIG